LGEAAMQYTENDRKKTQVFMLGLLKLLLQASKIELAYLKAQTQFERERNQFFC
jgi:hypothetical protein